MSSDVISQQGAGKEFSSQPKNFKEGPFKYHEVVVVNIDTLTNLGVGLGRIDNWVVMVPFTLPGERVSAKIFRNHKNYSEADLVEVLSPASDRIAPSCALFGTCGGCQYQHMRYEAQLRWKQFHVKEQLERHLKSPVTVLPTWPSPKEYFYRSKLTPHYPQPRNAEFPIGFLRDGSHTVIIDVPQCPIATPAINEALPATRQKLHSAVHKRGGTLLLRETDQGIETNPYALVTATVAGFVYEFRAGEFFQNNPFILPDFLGYITAQAKSEQTSFLVDAYCGCGVFGIAAHQAFERVVGIEISEAAVALARKNAERNQAQNSTFIAGSAECLFEGLDFPATKTSVILDPPRKGCDLPFLHQLMAFAPRRIVYVACAPDTQARDLEVLQNAYSIEAVQPFDLFPQTRHIENVVTLIRKG